MRVLSGIQPSGKLHLGNYLGAMKQHLALPREGCECFYFIANYHSLTTVQDADRLRDLTRDVAMDYLALGLDPERALLFRQSDVPEVTELTWILATVTGKGLLDRATSYKDKIAQGIRPSMGLYSYPILMAADILIYRSTVVPVGRDQLQHIEMAQDMAGYFNHTYGKDVLVRPEAQLDAGAMIPGIDGRKMSKSYGNTIELFEAPKSARKKIMAIKTDSKTVEEPKDPSTCNVWALLRHFVNHAELGEWIDKYKKGGVGYGEVKKRLAVRFEEQFGPARERRAALSDRPDDVEDVLASSAVKARAVAVEVMDDVRHACGLATMGARHR